MSQPKPPRAIRFSKRALKDLSALPIEQQEEIVDLLRQLAAGEIQGEPLSEEDAEFIAAIPAEELEEAPEN
ncbi:MAG: hypothetical protein K0S81_2575 [Rhodospirillales bacterium]|jgi:hypothetical protein|nr:hypothetical protein [Rhodospirillales bacterium]